MERKRKEAEARLSSGPSHFSGKDDAGIIGRTGEFCVEANLLQARRQLSHKVGSLGGEMSNSGARARRVHTGVDKEMDATSVSCKPPPCRARMYLYESNDINHFVREGIKRELQLLL
jgi:hypothetical protein